MKIIYERFAKRALLSILNLHFAFLSFAATYYVSSSGSDSNSGLITALAWKTLTKVNSFNPLPGDQILFKSGDVWEGTLTPASSGTSGNPIVYGSYGTGDKPKIYGSTSITGWTNHSGNIYKATVSSPVTQLFIGDTRMKLARYPNTGYLYITSVQSATQFTSPGLNSSINYVGATWVGRTTAFTIYSKTATASSSQTLTIDSAPVGSLTVGGGFFMCDKLAFLDLAGEWYYDKRTNTVYFWTPNGDSPSNYTIKSSIYDYGVSISSKSYVTIKDLNIYHNSIAGIYLNNGDYITIDNNTILSPDLYGIHSPNSGSTNTTVSNNYIYQANVNGIRLYSPLSSINYNKVENTGLLGNINKTQPDLQDNTGTGIFTRGSNITIDYNKVINSNYCGINFQGINNAINYNFVDGACLNLDDGGGIYTYNSNPTTSSGSAIKNNIVLHVFGYRNGWTNHYDQGYGIYLDRATTNVTVENNTIGYVSCGILVNFNDNCTYRYNTIFDAMLAVRVSFGQNNSVVSYNIIYSTNRIDDFVFWSNGYQRDVTFGGGTAIMDYNQYVHHYQTNTFANGSWVNFSTWKSSTGQDAHSTFDNSSLKPGETEKLYYNETNQPKTFNLGAAVYKDILGTQVTSSITLQPFTSKILIGTNSTLTVFKMNTK